VGKDWLDSVVLVTSNDPEIHDFGTGFVVHRDEQATFVLTCAHVLKAIGVGTAVRVNDSHAIVVAFGSDDGVDLAVLRVVGIDKTPLPLSIACEKGTSFYTAGFQLSGKEWLFRPLNGYLGERVKIGVTPAKFMNAWDLIIKDEYQLQPGNSGSPVIDKANKTVIGIVRTRQGDGRKGLAISIEALARIWPEMPVSILSGNSRTSAVISNEGKALPISSVVKELKELLQFVRPINFEKQSLFEKLQTIILSANLPETILEEIYYQCVPSDPLHPEIWTYPKENLFEALLKLDDVPEHVFEIPALLLFGKLLTPEIKEPYAAMLRQWFDEEGIHAWRITRDSQIAGHGQAFRISATHEPVSPMSSYPSLLITLTPAPIYISSFFVDAWLHCGQQENLVHLPLSDELSVSEKLYTPRTISQFIDSALKDMRKCSEYSRLSDEAKGNLCIEFFLPYYQLDMEVDNWHFDQGRDRVGRGIKLVVRPLEHINDRGLSGTPIDEVLWRKKWERVRSSLQETTLCWIHDYGEFSDKGVHNYINLKKKLDDEKMVCLFAPFAPSKLKLSKKGFFEAIIKTGTPIALWPRKLPNDPVKDIQEMFGPLQETYPNCVFKLSQIVFQQRRDSEHVKKDLYHIGRHLTLLWDDPNKLPPSSHFQQP
jgi:hypothetical protein